MGKLAIETRGLKKSFGTTHAVAGVDLAVSAGGVYGVLGPNGAGKTTTIRMLATLLRPDAGDAQVLGYDVVRDAQAVRSRVGLTGQFASVDEDLTGRRLAERRAMLEQALAGARPPVYVTPATQDLDVARQWFEQFEGAGLDGLIAKKLDLQYQPDKRVMSKIKHERTADCVVAGYRVHKSGPDALGSLLLGLYDDRGVLNSVGVIGAFPMAARRTLLAEMQPLVTTFDGHPWNWAAHEEGERTPRKNEASRWNAGKDLSFVPLRPERVVEVRYDHMEGERFRHTAQFNRWRPDRDPSSCTYAQLERPLTFSLGDIVPGLGPSNP